jgi:hypothetical protein
MGDSPRRDDSSKLLNQSLELSVFVGPSTHLPRELKRQPPHAMTIPTTTLNRPPISRIPRVMTKYPTATSP